MHVCFIYVFKVVGVQWFFWLLSLELQISEQTLCSIGITKISYEKKNRYINILAEIIYNKKHFSICFNEILGVYKRMRKKDYVIIFFFSPWDY